MCAFSFDALFNSTMFSRSLHLSAHAAYFLSVTKTVQEILSQGLIFITEHTHIYTGDNNVQMNGR